MTIVGLGTVQLGIPYGNAAHRGLMPVEEAYSILDEAVNFGIKFFDTAIAYGESEHRIGQYGLLKKSPDVLLTTKIPVAEPAIFTNKSRFWDFVVSHCVSSSQRLGIQQHLLLQFHQCDEVFLRSRSVVETFRDLISQQIVREIGISIYSVEQARAALETGFVSWLQIPVNLIDNRFLDPKLLKQFKDSNVKLIARSLLLQGVLTAKGPLPVVRKVEELGRLRELCQQALERSNLPILIEEACFRLVFGNYGNTIDVALLGVDSKTTFLQNLEIFKRATIPLPQNLLEELASARQYAESLDLFNPSTWNT